MFRSLGYDLVRLKHSAQQRPEAVAHQKSFTKGDLPLYIEFVGPSGVGKTTLFKETCRIRENDSNWLTPEEFIKLESPTVNDEIFNSTYQEIIKNQINNIIDRDHSPSDHLKLLSFFYRNIINIALVHHHNKNYTVLFEDGLFHNFGDSLTDLHQTNCEGFNDIISNSAVIFCTNKPETIAKQIRERKRSSSILHPHHQFESFSELVEYQKIRIKEIDKRIGLFRQYNLPILEINTSEDLEENAAKVNGFINKLCKK